MKIKKTKYFAKKTKVAQTLSEYYELDVAMHSADRFKFMTFQNLDERNVVQPVFLKLYAKKSNGIY